MQNKDFNNMDQETKEMIFDLNKRVRRIEGAMLGDDKYGSTGFVNRYEKTEKIVKENKEKIEKIWVYAGAVSLVAVVIFEVVKTLFF